MGKNKLPASYVRLKKYTGVVEEICKDIDLRAYGFDPGVLFIGVNGEHLELPEWFLESLYKYVTDKCE